MKELLEPSNRNLKINIIEILSALVEKNGKHVCTHITWVFEPKI